MGYLHHDIVKMDSESTMVQLIGNTGMADHTSEYKKPLPSTSVLIIYQKLLASPTFHRAVQNVHKKVRHLRQGPDLEELGGTKIDSKHCRRERMQERIPTPFKSLPKAF